MAVVRLLLLSGLVGCGAPSAAHTYEVAWSEFDRLYALFGVKGIDWDALHHAPPGDAGADALFGSLTTLLAPLDDNHVQLLSDRPPWVAGNLEGRLRDTFHPDVTQAYLSEHQDPHPMVRTGVLAGVGYLWLGRLDATTTALAGDYLATAPPSGLILDLRQNTGGYHRHAEALASWFVTQPRIYSRLRRRIGPEHDAFGEWLAFDVEPRPTGYPGPVAILTDPYTVSGAENLLLALEAEPHIVRVGTTTAGAFGARLWRDLPNGWVVSVTVDDVRDAGGESLEGIGIHPDVAVSIDLSDLEATTDPILDAALVALGR